jgi:hypothetical protein
MGEASLLRARPHQIDNTIARYVEWYESVRRRALGADTHRAGRERERVHERVSG